MNPRWLIIRLFFLMLVGCLLITVPSAASQLTRFESGHITLITDNEKAGRATIENLEQARSALLKLGLPMPATNKPITVLLVSKQSFLRQAWPADNPETGTWGGLTYPFEDRVYVLADLSRPEADKNILHEFVHALIGQSFTIIPRWLNEGIAEHYSTVSVRDGRAVLGELDSRRRWAQGNCSSAMPFAETINLQLGSLDQQRTGAFYLSAALNVRYLVEQFGAKKIIELLQLLQDEVPAEHALQQVFGEGPAGIEAAAVRSCKSKNLVVQSAAFESVNARIVAFASSEDEFQDSYSDLLARIAGRQEAAITSLQAVLRTNANDELANRGLGVALTYKGDFEAAIPHLIRAQEKLNGDVTTLYHLIIACSNSSSCLAEDYSTQIQRLLDLRPDLRRTKDWAALSNGVSIETDEGDSGFLTDEKPESDASIIQKKAPK